MPSPRLFFWIVVLVMLVSLACGGAGESPTNPAPAPPPTTVPPFESGPTQPGNLENASVAQVIDGDTVELADGRRVRYIGMNTPERGQPYYKEATRANRQLVDGRQVQLEFDADTFDRYGRTLAYIWADGKMVNLQIVGQGFANVFTVPPNVKYEQEFRAAEQLAREAGRGLWAGSGVDVEITQIHANAPGNDNENPNGEWIELVNRGSAPVLLRGFTLKDEANHIYTFADFSAGPGQPFRLYSGPGRDTSTELYWGLDGDSVWNNNGDTAFLRDTQGALVDSFAY